MNLKDILIYLQNFAAEWRPDEAEILDEDEEKEFEQYTSEAEKFLRR